MAKKKEKVITVFGSSRPREGQADYEMARELGRQLAERGFAVCSGGYGGVMEGVSRGAKESGGRVLGVTSRAFRAKTNRWVDQEIRVGSWRDRLFELVRRGDGYVACKGGTGTLAELAVVWEMQNKGLMRGVKPFVVLGDFWTPVLELMRWVERERGPDWDEGEDAMARAATAPRAAAEFLAARLLVGEQFKGKLARLT
jgi:uncharacterized protein (TIGR00725 family)